MAHAPRDRQLTSNPFTPQADVALLRLPAPSLRGTFSKAYALLTRLVSQIGWDELLRTRSSVFVMEEEYRQQKAKPEASAPAPAPESESEPVSHSRGSSLASSTEGEAGGARNGLGAPAHDIPTIKISSESDRDKEELEMANAGLNLQNVSLDVEAEGTIVEGDESTSQAVTNGGFSPDGDMTPKLEKPELAQHPADDKESGADAAEGVVKDDETVADPEPDDKFSFSTKRLCERWLDNLFMVLYEVHRDTACRSGSRADLTCICPLAARTSAYTPSGGRRSRISRRSTCRTARLVPRCVAERFPSPCITFCC